MTGTTTGAMTGTTTGAVTGTTTGAVTGTTTGTGSADHEFGYWTSGNLSGYVWHAVSTDSTLLASGSGPYCANGTVGATYNDHAMIGFNLVQVEEATDTGTLVPMSDGLEVDLDNTGGSPLRVQIQGPNGGTDENDRWCANYDGNGVIAWTDFNTACWDNSGSFYDFEPLEAALIQVPGDISGTREFDFCINSIAESGNGGGGGGAGAGGAGAGGAP